MPTDEPNSDANENAYGFAGSLLSVQNAMTALSTIAVAYGAYKVIGNFFNSSAIAPFSQSAQLSHWEDLGPQRALVHTVRSSYRGSSPLFKHPAKEIFRTWDIISTSLIDASLIRAARHGTERYNGLGGSVGFILEVPPQNILGTHPHDVSFPNDSKGRGLADKFLSGTSKNSENSLNYPHYNRLMTPDDLLNKRNTGFFSTLFSAADYNEVLIAGRANVRTYEGYPATDTLKVKGIVLIPEAATGRATNEDIALVEDLKAVNSGLPVYGISNRTFFQSD